MADDGVNPLAAVLLVIGVLFVVVAIFGSQNKVFQAVTGHAVPAPAASGAATALGELFSLWAATVAASKLPTGGGGGGGGSEEPTEPDPAIPPVEPVP